jgi:long-chain fatty acid transport protein
MRLRNIARHGLANTAIGLVPFVSAMAAMVVGVTTAQAGGFAVREQSAYGQGSSFAGMAAPGQSISSMYWNPAAVTIATGVTVEGNVTGVFPRSELDVDPSRSTLTGLGITGNGGNVSESGVVPAAYFAVPLTEQFFVGLSVNAPYGFSTTSDSPWVGMFSHLNSEVMSINVTPVMGIKFNDMVSVAFGVQVQYFDVNIETALTTGSNPRKQSIKGDSTDVGVVAGITLTPFDGTTIGVGYRSQIDTSLNGTQTFEVPIGGGLIPAGRYGITADVELPQMISVGVRQRVNDAFTVMAGMEWTNWSSIQTVPFVGSPAGSQLALNFDDGWFFSAGGEYKFNPNFTLRAGIGYEISPVTDEDRTMRLADADRVWASIGASYNWNERLSFDAGYSHVFVDDAPVDETTAGIRYAGTAEGSADVVSVGLRYKFGG